MTSFKFPPPPPPPPKASSSNDSHQAYTNQRGGYNRGRGDGVRGRGGGQSRGGSNQSFGGNARGGFGQANARGGSNNRGGLRGSSGGGYQNNNAARCPRGGSNSGYGQQRYQHTSSPMNAPPTPSPALAYVNPSFVGQSHAGGQMQPLVDPTALVQAMSFMSTPAGQQSMAAFANHMAGVGNAAPQYSQSPPPQYAQPAPRFPPPQHAGQKRKLNDRNHNTQPKAPSQPKPPQQSTKPPRAKAAVPPPVPSFGFSLPTPPAVKPITVSKGKGKKDTKKRKLNLGLTKHPISEESSDDEEEDIDEEVKYSAQLKGGGFAFEHDGERISIQTAAEVAAWVKDRKRQYPTQKRIMEKAQEAAMKRKNELEFLRKLHGRAPKPEASIQKEKPRKLREETKHNKKERVEDGRRQDGLAALRKKLHESMLEKQAKSSAVDLGLGYDSETASDEESSVLSESSVVSSSEESSDESDSESVESDEAPEPISSKVGPPPIKAPPPAHPPALAQSTPGKRKICPSWEQHGRCSYSNKCKFAHPPKEVKRVGLYDMMVEQELVKADQLALDAIKYLGQHGFLG